MFLPRAAVIVPLTPLSRSSLDTGACIFAVHAGRFGGESQDRFHPAVVKTAKLFPVRDAFLRQEMRSSSSALSSGDSAPTSPQVSPSGLPARVFSGTARAAVATDDALRFFDFSSPAAPPATPGQRNERLRARRAPWSDATFTHDWYIRGPGPRPPRPPLLFRAMRKGEGLLWAEAACRILQTRLQHTGTSTCVASAPASEPRAPREANDSLAFALRLPSRSTPPAARRRSTTRSGFALSRRPLAEPAEVQPRARRPGAKGPQPFGLFADSPPPKPAEHPFVTRSLPPRPGELRSRLTWSITPGFPG